MASWRVSKQFCMMICDVVTVISRASTDAAGYVNDQPDGVSYTTRQTAGASAYRLMGSETVADP